MFTKFFIGVVDPRVFSFLQDLAALDFESMQLPPMDPTAKPSTSRYSLHFLLTSPETLPPVSEFCPRQVLMLIIGYGGSVS
jgi:hypothetical protein